MGLKDRSLVNPRPLKTRRKELRKNPTAAETVLREHLQRRQLLGKKFRRQYGIGRYIVDFFCPELNIAIELDGAPHFRELLADYEAERTAFLMGLGIEILRFENRIVYRNLEAVLDAIRDAIRLRDLPPAAPSLR